MTISTILSLGCQVTPELSSSSTTETAVSMMAEMEGGDSTTSSTTGDYNDIPEQITPDDLECSSPMTFMRQPWVKGWYNLTVALLGGPSAALLPHAFAFLTWTGGLTVFAVVTAGSYMSGLILTQLQESHMKTYSDVADGVMGKGFSNIWIRPFQVFFFFYLGIQGPLVTGESLALLGAELSASGQEQLSVSMWTVVAGAMFLLLALIPSIDKMWFLSLVGTIGGLVSCLLLVIGSARAIAGGSREGVNYGRPEGYSNTEYGFGVLESFGNIVLSYAGFSFLPDLHAALSEDAKGRSAKTSMLIAMRAAYAVIVPAYLAVAITGYLAFGSDVKPYLLDSLVEHSAHGGPSFTITLNICIILNQVFKLGLCLQAAFTLIDDIFPKLKNTRIDVLFYTYKQLLVRISFVTVCTAIAVKFPFFGALSSLAGSLGDLPLTFVFPFIIWAHSKSAKEAPKWKRWLNWITAASFAVFGLAGTVGASYSIALLAGAR